MRVLIAGASGLIGTELQRQLTEAGHEIRTLVRREPKSPTEFTWAPDAKILDFRLLDEVDAVINLSGASLNHLPWTAGYREQILRSRVKATQALVEAMAMTSSPPPVFLSGSAVGIYGDRPGTRLTEDAAPGEGFLPDVVEAWEAAASLAPDKTRTVFLRTGLVLAPKGGALDPLRLLTKLGISGPLGTGGQHWPWISLHDEAAAIVHLLTSDLSGPVNLAGPTPATASRIGARLAADLHRPFAIPVPEKVIELALRDAGRELLLASQKVVPARLLADGFAFRYETSDQAIDAIS
nr:TIGR01777 family oxidoreductase [Amnibacterium flavum]